MSKQTFPQLYSRDSKGKTRIWSISVVDDTFTVTHGLEFGKMQNKSTKCKGKNIGKANETSPFEQAQLEAESKHRFQIEREDYATDPENSNQQVRPQLALDATKVGHRISWEATFVVAQPKIDGLRLTYGKRWFNRECYNEFMTRKGDNYDVDHLTDACNALLDIIKQSPNTESVSLDGELYIHGLPLNKIVSYAKKYKKGLTEQLKYYLFDLVIPNMSFINRYTLLTIALSKLDDKHRSNFVLVPITYLETEAQYNLEKIETVKADGKKEVKYIAKEGTCIAELHGEYLSQGFEGTMFRHPYAMYDIGKRSSNLFKYKSFKDTEVRIVDVWLDKNGNAMLSCVLKNGLECNVTPKRTHDERKQMWVDREDYIGKWITVKYFEETEAGNLQFPVGLDLRECTDDGTPIE